METVHYQFLRNKVFEKLKHSCASCYHVSDKVVKLLANQNAASVVVMILSGLTSSELAFSAFDISGYFVSKKAEIIIRIRSLNISINFYGLIWYCCLFYHLYDP